MVDKGNLFLGLIVGLVIGVSAAAGLINGEDGPARCMRWSKAAEYDGGKMKFYPYGSARFRSTSYVCLCSQLEEPR